MDDPKEPIIIKVFILFIALVIMITIAIVYDDSEVDFGLSSEEICKVNKMAEYHFGKCSNIVAYQEDKEWYFDRDNQRCKLSSIPKQLKQQIEMECGQEETALHKNFTTVLLDGFFSTVYRWLLIEKRWFEQLHPDPKNTKNT